MTLCVASLLLSPLCISLSIFSCFSLFHFSALRPNAASRFPRRAFSNFKKEKLDESSLPPNFSFFFFWLRGFWIIANGEVERREEHLYSLYCINGCAAPFHYLGPLTQTTPSLLRQKYLPFLLLFLIFILHTLFLFLVITT